MLEFLSYLQKAAFYGCIGLLIEVVFTGIHSLFIQKNLKATGYTYLYMFPVYAFAGITLEALNDGLVAPFYIRAIIFTPVIYGIEAISGLCLLSLIGFIPWDYKHSKFSPLGLVNFKYIFWWFGLAMLFPWVSYLVKKVVGLLVTL
jgi:uncharacterized membrane protein